MQEAFIQTFPSVRSRIYASIVRLPAVMPGPARICADLFRVSGYPAIRASRRAGRRAPRGFPAANRFLRGFLGPLRRPRRRAPPPHPDPLRPQGRRGREGRRRLAPPPRGREGEKAGAACVPPPPFRGEGGQGEVGASVQCPARDGRMRLRGAPASRAPRAWTRIARPARVDARRQVRAGQAMTACGRDRIGGCAHRSNIMRTSESGHRLGLGEQEIWAVLLSWGYSIALNDFFYLRVGLSNDRVYCF